MKERITAFIKESEFFEWYYLIVVLGYIATLFTSLARPGVIATLAMCVVAVLLVIRRKMNIHSVMDVLIVVYFIYKALSVIWLTRAGMPIGVYTGEFVVSLFPMIFYFAGRSMQDDAKPFYSKFIAAIVLLGVIGAVLYITAPQFYCNYLYDWTYISKADVSTMRVRMQSVVGSTVFGAINIFAMASGIKYLSVDGSDKISKSNRRFGLFACVFCMIFAILSNQRSAMVAALILAAYICIVMLISNSSISKKQIVIAIAAFVVVCLALCIFRMDFVHKIWARLASLPGAISERSEQWVAAVNNMYSSWFGNGLGANGHRAIGIEGAHIIADGGLIKMYCEEGVLGFSVFVYILFLTIRKGIGNIKEMSAEIAIVVMALLLSIGSNVLAFQMVTPIFWFAIGQIWSRVNDEEVFKIKIRVSGEKQ